MPGFTHRAASLTSHGKFFTWGPRFSINCQVQLKCPYAVGNCSGVYDVKAAIVMLKTHRELHVGYADKLRRRMQYYTHHQIRTDSSEVVV